MKRYNDLKEVPYTNKAHTQTHTHTHTHTRTQPHTHPHTHTRARPHIFPFSCKFQSRAKPAVLHVYRAGALTFLRSGWAKQEQYGGHLRADLSLLASFQKQQKLHVYLLQGVCVCVCLCVCVCICVCLCVCTMQVKLHLPNLNLSLTVLVVQMR